MNNSLYKVHLLTANVKVFGQSKPDGFFLACGAKPVSDNAILRRFLKCIEFLNADVEQIRIKNGFEYTSLDSISVAFKAIRYTSSSFVARNVVAYDVTHGSVFVGVGRSADCAHRFVRLASSQIGSESFDLTADDPIDW